MPDQRIEACRRALELAGTVGIDQLRMQETFLVDPPAGLAERMRELVGKNKPRFGRTRVEDPSAQLMETALAAVPYLMSVNFCHGKVDVVGASDAGDDLSVIITEDGWNRLRPQLEEILGTPLGFDKADLDDPFVGPG